MAACYWSTFNISPNKAAQQLIRFRHNLSGTGFIAFSDTPNYFANSLPLDLNEIRTLIDRKENCVTNVLNEDGGLLISERIYTPAYARSMFSYRLLMKAVHKSPSLYRRLVNHYNGESGFTTIPKDVYHKLKPASTALHQRFLVQMTDVNDYVLSPPQLVNIVASYSGSIPPYTRDYQIDYSNLNIQRVDLMDE